MATVGFTILAVLTLYALMGAITVSLFVRNVQRDTHDVDSPLFSSWIKVFIFWPFPLFCWMVIQQVEQINRLRAQEEETKNAKDPATSHNS